MQVHFLNPPEPEYLIELRALLDQGITLSIGDIQPGHAQVDILVAGRPTADQLSQFDDLKSLIIPWTGIPPETLNVIRRFPDINLHNLHHNAGPVAELALALLFAVAKKIIPFDARLREGDWEMRYRDRESILLAGKRALIVGYGQIGKRIGRALRPLGLQVQAIRRTAGNDEDPYIHPPHDLHELLPCTDILFLALPFTEDTEDLIDETELAALPDPAILINISRGGVVNQEALYSVLKEKNLFGAGLDVWYNYPQDEADRSNTYPGDFPFHDLDNVVLSPHRAGLVRETGSLRMHALAVLINAAARGKPMPNLVDINQGY